ncbi:MAG: DUF2461 domain-containing protein [Oscillospiraceae bacterium]|nr:DUF2461 domain-containing protein [Oscillospiraceae bacterium]
MPFSTQSLDFLFENRLHDSKSWFDEHRETFQTLVLQPLQQLVTDLTPCALEIDSRFVTEPRIGRTISRIRRDTRFSKDKSIYRDYMWIHFDRPNTGLELPCVYFDMGGDGFGYGCGLYSPSTGYMDTLRRLVLEGNPVFLQAKKAYEQQTVFTLEGKRYKRPHYPDQPEDLRCWLELRGISFSARSKDFPLLFSDRLADRLKEELPLLKPFYDFLVHVGEVQAAHGS